MKHQCLASSVSRSSVFSDFPVSRLFPLPDAQNLCGWQRQGFRAEYAQTRLRKILPETAFAARPCRCRQSHTLPLHPSIGNG